jgi:hypothetical protein
MTAIQSQIEVDATPSRVSSVWPHFVQWVLTGNRRLSCDEFACVNAVDSGNVDFEPIDDGLRSRVVFRLEVPGDEPGPSQDELERHVFHDLIVFKDYVERDGSDAGRPTADEAFVLEREADVQGSGPRHVHLSSEDDTTFWRSHFPT